MVSVAKVRKLFLDITYSFPVIGMRRGGPPKKKYLRTLYGITIDSYSDIDDLK
jgi:hypothetical protein